VSRWLYISIHRQHKHVNDAYVSPSVKQFSCLMPKQLDWHVHITHVLLTQWHLHLVRFRCGQLCWPWLRPFIGTVSMKMSTLSTPITDRMRCECWLSRCETPCCSRSRCRSRRSNNPSQWCNVLRCRLDWSHDLLHQRWQRPQHHRQHLLVEHPRHVLR